MNSLREHGRSMVEILGVLAIVGVLSIGSIWGLRQSFNKKETNDIVAELNQMAIIAHTQATLGHEIDLSEFKNDEITWVDEDKGNQDGFFSITVELSDEVISNLINMGWNLPYEIYVDGIALDDYDLKIKSKKEISLLTSLFVKTAEAAEPEKRTVKFVFHKQLNPDIKPERIGEDDCGKTGGKWDGKRCFCPTGSYMTKDGCVTKCGEDTGIDCPTETICYRDEECLGCAEICQNGKCVIDDENMCNNKNTYCDNNQIKACRYIGRKPRCLKNEYTVEDCAFKGKICSDKEGMPICYELENRCPEGYYNEGTEDSKSCIECSKITRVDAILHPDCKNCSDVEVIDFTANGKDFSFCYPKCPSGQYYELGTGCVPCSEFEDDTLRATGTCPICSNVELVDGICKNKSCGPGYYNEGTEDSKSCIECSKITRVDAILHPDCKNCSDVEVIDFTANGKDFSFCYPKCPSGQYYELGTGCVPCSEFEDDTLRATGTCPICSNVELVDGICKNKS